MGHVTNLTANERLYYNTYDHAVVPPTFSPNMWDDALGMQQQQQQFAAAAAAGLFRKSPSYNQPSAAMQQQMLYVSSSLNDLPQQHSMEQSLAAAQLHQQARFNHAGVMTAVQAASLAHLNQQQAQMTASLNTHHASNLPLQLPQMHAMHMPLLPAHSADAAAQQLHRQAMLAPQVTAPYFPPGRPAGPARMVARVPKLGTVQTYNPVTGVRTLGSGAAGVGVGGTALPRPLGIASACGTYLRQTPAAASGNVGGVYPGPVPAAASQQVQASQLASLQALVLQQEQQQQQQQLQQQQLQQLQQLQQEQQQQLQQEQQQQRLGTYRVLSALQGNGADNSSTDQQQAALMQSLLFPQHQRMSELAPSMHLPDHSFQPDQDTMAPVPDMCHNLSEPPPSFAAHLHLGGRGAMLGLPDATTEVLPGHAAAGAADGTEEDLGALLHCIGTELARHNISIAAATEAGWLGSVSPAANAALVEAHAAEAARLQRGCSGNGAAPGTARQRGGAGSSIASSMPTSGSGTTSLSSTVDEISSLLEDCDPFHQGSVGSVSPGAALSLAAVEEPLQQQITQLLATAGDGWTMEPGRYLGGAGLGGQAIAGAGASSAGSLGGMAASLDFYQRGMERTRSGTMLSAPFATLNLGVGFT